jgi:hypothetical protein
MEQPRRKQDGFKLTFVVWQFVRVMVQLEKTGSKSHAYRAWRDQWKKLDRRLDRLGKGNRAAFSTLMMTEEVVIDKVTAAELSDVRRALDTVIRQINTDIQTSEPEDELLGGLEFELTELAALRDEVRAMAPTAPRTARRKGPDRKPKRAS